jgi:hypothetical protein
MDEEKKYCAKSSAGWAPADVIERRLNWEEVSELWEEELAAADDIEDDDKRAAAWEAFEARWWEYIEAWQRAWNQWLEDEK